VAAVVREIERKYDVTGANTAQLDSVPGAASVSPATEEVLDAVYYDTEDLRLIRSGITLRQRSGGPEGIEPAGPVGPGEPGTTPQGGPRPGSRMIQVRLTREQAQLCEQAASRQGLAVPNWAAQALDRAARSGL